jgi:uncharacterized membrane protein
MMRLFGHPLHPMLVHFPIAFWSLAAICDGMALAGNAQAWEHSWKLLALGLVIALPAMFAGFLDLAALSDRAERDGQRHMLCMGLAWTLFLIALMTRFEGTTLMPVVQAISVACTMFGLVIMTAGGWYGGQLVYRHGAGLN